MIYAELGTEAISIISFRPASDTEGGCSMTAEYPKKDRFEPGHGYTEEDWNAVDSPELTKKDFARMRPAKEVLPQGFFEGLEEARRARGRPKTGNAKEAVTLRLDAETVERFKRAGGSAWRSLMASAIEKASPK